MNDSDQDKVDTIGRIFLPRLFSERDRILQSGNSFSHYTSADTVLKVVRGASWWLRSAAVMNDFSEIDYGFQLFRTVLEKHNERFSSVLNSIGEKFVETAGQRLEVYLRIAKFESYVASFTEHDNELDRFGKLSMWRAYGGRSGAALVLNKQPFFQASANSSVLMSPVFYADDGIFESMFLSILDNVEINNKILREMDLEILSDFWAKTLVVMFLTTKHLGFAEEREWRLIYTPTLRNEPSQVVRTEVHSVEGYPQKIAVLPLANNQKYGLEGLEPFEIIERVIVGPCQYPMSVAMAIDHELSARKFSNASERVTISRIPLRQ
jgi:hypothetical protein